MARALLVLGGSYVTSLVLSFVYLVIGAAVTGRSISAGERGLLAVLAGTALTFMASAMVVLFGLGRGFSWGARAGLTLGYSVVAFVTFLVLGVIGMIVFNR